jgi:hypothetical protein
MHLPPSEISPEIKLENEARSHSEGASVCSGEFCDEKEGMEGGYIKLWRKTEQWEWVDDPTVFYVFFRMLLMCNWEDRQWHGKTIGRGTFISSRAKLAAKLHISEKALRTSTDKLKTCGQLATLGASNHTTYILVNYNKYQSTKIKGPAEGPAKGRTKGQQRASEGPTTKEVKEVKEVKELKQNPCSTSSLNFDKFWQTYPRKQGKHPSLKTWNKLKPTQELTEIILKAVLTQKESEAWKKNGGQFIPMPATWLNQHRWEDQILKIEDDDEPFYKKYLREHGGKAPHEL